MKNRNTIAASSYSKVFTIFIVLVASTVFLVATFGSHPYPYVHDSTYIFSSLSLLTNHTISHNDHPGLILQVVGTLPVLLGAVLTHGDSLIEKVIVNLPLFQQLFVGLVGLSLIGALIVFLWTAYQKDKPIQSVVMALIGVALFAPPSLGKAMGVNSDFYAFSLSFLYVTSLLWKRNRKNDMITSLFFVLMVYTKITYVPLFLLMFTMNKESLRRLLTGTLLWSVVVFLLFWDFDQLSRFRSFMLNASMRNKPSTLNLAAMLKFHTKFFVRNKAQSFYILLFLLFGILLTFKKEFRTTGILGLVIIIVAVEITLFRQYKAAIYTWSAFPVGMLLTLTLLKAYPRSVALVAPVFIVLFIASAGILYKNVVKNREIRVDRLAYQQEYKKIVADASPNCLLEDIGQPYSFFSIGYFYWLANAKAKFEYSPYLEEYFKDRFGLKNLYYLKRDKNGNVKMRQYFDNVDVEGSQWTPSRDYYLATKAGAESEFREKFPQLEFILIKTIKPYNINIWNVRQRITTIR